MTFIQLLRLARTQLKFLVALTLIGGSLAFIYAQRVPAVYASDASGYVLVAGSGASTGDALAGSALAGSKAASYLPLVTSRAVAANAIERTGIKASPSAVAARVTASVVPDSNVLKIYATGPTPEEAQALADAVMVATADEVNRLEGGQAVTATPSPTTSKSSTATASTSGGDTADRVPTTPTGSGLVRILPIENALLSTSPVAPNVPKLTVIGLIVGFGVAAGIVMLRRMLDTRIRTVADVEEMASTTVLGVVPMTPELAVREGRGRIGRLGLAAESFRQLRTNLRFVNVDSPPRSIVITSANASEGKSTMSATLARVLGEAGQPTIIIDADLRRPMLATIFDAHSSVGLSQVLSGQIPVEEAMQSTDQPNVRLITAGRTPPNPSELLGSQRMHALIEELSRDHLVILDAPPLLPVTDAGLLTAMSDGALMVFAVGRTHKEQAKQCAKVMDQVGGRVLGCILNMAPRKGMGAVVYGYGTGYGSYNSDYYTQQKYVGKRSRGKRSKDKHRATEPSEA